MAGGLLNDKTIGLFKLEVTKGTDPTPTGAADAIRLLDSSSFTTNPEVVQRSEFNGSLSQGRGAVTVSTATIVMSFYMKGSGAAGTAPEFGPLLKACGLKETVVASTSVAYTPSSDDADLLTGTCYWYEDGIVQRANYCSGSLAIAANVQQDWVGTVTLRGIMDEEVDEANPAVTYQATEPVLWLGRNGGVAEIDSTAAKITSFNLDMGLTVQGLGDANAQDGICQYDHVDRNVSGDVNPAQVSVATRDLFGKLRANTSSTMQMVNGNTAGNIMTLDIPEAVWTGQTPVNDAGHRRRTHAFQAAGENSEFTLTFT